MKSKGNVQESLQTYDYRLATEINKHLRAMGTSIAAVQAARPLRGRQGLFRWYNTIDSECSVDDVYAQDKEIKK